VKNLVAKFQRKKIVAEISVEKKSSQNFSVKKKCRGISTQKNLVAKFQCKKNRRKILA
jgi:hypothetical protein